MKTRKLLFQTIVAICILFLFPPIDLYNNREYKEQTCQPKTAETDTDLPYFLWGGYGGESGFDIARDSLNNTYIVGETSSFGAGYSDVCLLKLNSSGELEWNKTYGGINHDIGKSIVIDTFDNIYITGFTDSYGVGSWDIWVLKINAMGIVEWNYTWGGVEDDYGWAIALDAQNNVYVAGRTNSFGAGNFDMCIVKFNSSGAEWNKTAGGAGYENGYGLTLDPQGNIYVVGSTNSYGRGGEDLYFVKFNSTGMIWNKTWGCADDDQGTDIIYSPSGDLYISGYYQKAANCSEPSSSITFDYFVLIKFTSNGIYRWNNTWDAQNSYAMAMEMDSSGNTYLAGYTNPDIVGDYDMCLVRFNSSGIVDWSCNWGGSESDDGLGLVLGFDGTALVVGRTQSYGKGFSDLCMVEFKIGQCPVNTPEDGNPVIPGYYLITLIGIIFTTLVFMIKINLKDLITKLKTKYKNIQ